MGLIHSGPPTNLILELQQQYALTDFIESGTYHGDTAAWSAQYFVNVITIEASKPNYEIAKAKCGTLPNVDLRLGDSRDLLREIVPTLDHAAVFWLDGHWSGEGTYGENDECPLLDELRTIRSSHQLQFLFVDDARLFLSPPPKPHNKEQWPTIAAVLQEIGRAYYVVIFGDVIIAVPPYASETLANYCQERAMQSWQAHASQQKKPSIKQLLRRRM